MSWTVLGDGTDTARILFSNPAKARNLALGIVALIVVGAVTHIPVTFALILSFLFFRPWLGRQETNSKANGEFIRLLAASPHAGAMARNRPAVDDFTKGTNPIFGGWREVFVTVVGSLLSSFLLTIAYFVGIYGADRTPGYRFFVVFGVCFAVLFSYYVVLSRRTSVEYYKKKRAETNVFGRYLTLLLVACRL